MRGISITARTLPGGWERAVIDVNRYGTLVCTEYDKSGDSPSMDAPLTLMITHPFEEPRIHRCFWGAPEGLLGYVDEVVRGVVDDRVREFGYVYHNRLTDYPSTPRWPERNVNQLAGMVAKLKVRPYSRRAQAITWIPSEDIGNEESPCLQRVWGRVVNSKLVFHVHMRSWDVLKAGFMNLYAFTELQRWLAEQLGVEPGYYLHFADSAHIYGSDLKFIEGFKRRATQNLTGEKSNRWTTEELLLMIHTEAVDTLSDFDGDLPEGYGLDRPQVAIML